MNRKLIMEDGFLEEGNKVKSNHSFILLLDLISLINDIQKRY